MKQQKLNYEAKVVCCNGAISAFDFHGDNAPLATAHIQHVANAGIDGLNFDYTPDKIHHISYKSKANVKWNCVFPQPKDESKEVSHFEFDENGDNIIVTESKEVKEGGELFTGGEWYVSESCAGEIKTTLNELPIADATYKSSNGVKRSVPEIIANAALIAQAPAMYAFIKEMAERYSNSEWIAGRAKEIILKATPKK